MSPRLLALLAGLAVSSVIGVWMYHVLAERWFRKHVIEGAA